MVLWVGFASIAAAADDGWPQSMRVLINSKGIMAEKLFGKRRKFIRCGISKLESL